MSTTLCQLDDNLVPGQTYTFQLKCSNWLLVPSTDTVQLDITQNAPDFIGSLQVTSPVTTSLYNCQFTYGGDGTDVVSDVANELIAACLTGSNDNFTFIGAVPNTAQSITVSISSAAQTVSDTVGAAVSNATSGVAKDVANAAQTVLTPIETLLVVAVVLVAVLIYTSGKAGGVDIAGVGGVGGSR